MSDINFICPTCKRPTQLDNEMIEYLVNEKNKYRDILGERTKELDRTRKALDVLLLTINRLENQNYKDCAWHLRLAIAKIKAIGIADTALEQITAEQKD